MGVILEYCQGLSSDDNLERIFFSQSDPNNNRINRRYNKKEINPFITLNSTGENNISQYIIDNKLKNEIKYINSEDNNIITDIKNENMNEVKNEIANSFNKMGQIIESLEAKNRFLENENCEIKKENTKLLKEIEIYKNTISSLKNNGCSNDFNEDINKIEKANDKLLNKNNEEQIKIIFIFKNNNNKANEKNRDLKEEIIIAYKYEMFIEVKMSLLNLRNLDPRDIKACYYNSKEINDWYTLEELNFSHNAYVTCEYA